MSVNLPYIIFFACCFCNLIDENSITLLVEIKSILFAPKLPSDYAVWLGEIKDLSYFKVVYGNQYLVHFRVYELILVNIFFRKNIRSIWHIMLMKL